MREYREDLTGRHFGAWRVLRLARPGGAGHHPVWECRCACGKVKDVRGDALTRGLSTSCGCHTNADW